MINRSKTTIAAFAISAACLTTFIPASQALAAGETEKPSAKIIKKLSAGPAGGYNVAINGKTNRVYIANFAGNVSVLDGKTNQIIDTIADPLGPQAIAINEDNDTLYVVHSNGTISVIDGETNMITDTYTVDTNGSGQYGLFTQDIVFSRKTGKLYVSNASTQIDVVDPKTKSVKVIPDDNANFLAINQRTNKIYAPQYWDGTVSVIDGDTDQIVATVNNVGVNRIRRSWRKKWKSQYFVMNIPLLIFPEAVREISLI